MKRRTQKITYNIVVGVLIACGIAWVSAKFIHLGKVEYTDNAQVKNSSCPSTPGYKASSRKSISMNIKRYVKAIHLPLSRMRSSAYGSPKRKPITRTHYPGKR